ncbi:MAG: hypothetical protein J7539_02875 [Niabella sp.]|nr:hypothetical protein [Niabella sp.]
MKKKSIIQLLLFIVVPIGIGLLQGCDYAQIMILQATGENGDSIVLYGNRMIAGASYPGKIVIRVPQNDTTRKTFYFGRGNWSDASLERLADNIDSLVITNNNKIKRLTGKAILKVYLQDHCKGFAHNELVLEAK